MSEQLFTTAEVAAALGVAEHDVENAIRRRLVPRPAMLGRSRAWTEADVDLLRTALVARRLGRGTRALPQEADSEAKCERCSRVAAAARSHLCDDCEAGAGGEPAR